MSTVARSAGTAVERVQVSAFQVPTATEHESDGTLEWDSVTCIVVRVHGGDQVGTGYGYGTTAVAELIDSKLRDEVAGADPYGFDVQVVC